MAMAFAMTSRRSSNRSYSTETQRHAARQLAVNLQKTLLVNKADRAALKQVDMEAGRAVALPLPALRRIERVEASRGCQPRVGVRDRQHEGPAQGLPCL
jgi:hypothetical protein